VVGGAPSSFPVLSSAFIVKMTSGGDGVGRNNRQENNPTWIRFKYGKSVGFPTI
jgi:hypothetical protein